MFFAAIHPHYPTPVKYAPAGDGRQTALPSTLQHLITIHFSSSKKASSQQIAHQATLLAMRLRN
eukprot:810640-Amphidinium_carterae.2